MIVIDDAHTISDRRVFESLHLLLNLQQSPSLEFTLILAGHTHCGQISFPLVGALYYESKYDDRFGCGVTSGGGAKRVITSAGLGTSMLALRLGAVPDVWLITLGPGRRRHRD